MGYFEFKTLLAAFFSAAAAIALLTMMAVMGRSDHTVSPAKLRAAHRIAGYAFVGLMIAAAIAGARYLRAVGDALPTRGVLHVVLALLLVAVVAIKVSIARFFRQFLKYAPAIGMIAFVLAFAVASISAGFFVVTRTGARRVDGASTRAAGPTGREADASAGEDLFALHCAVCHSAETDEAGIGPGLAGLFRRGVLGSSGRAVTRSSLAEQIREPEGAMPAFGDRLSNDEIDDLVAYLVGLDPPETP